jgi:hypothetical protein
MGSTYHKPVIASFPENVVLSGVGIPFWFAFITGAINIDEVLRGLVLFFRILVWVSKGPDINLIVVFVNDHACFEFMRAAEANVGFCRWRKLLYNACLNSLCAITDLDTGRIQLADGAVETLVRPAMQEIRAAAKACGHDLPEELVDFMIKLDPITMYNPPSMQVDIRMVCSNSWKVYL